MCGIIGISSNKPVSANIINSLKENLELNNCESEVISKNLTLDKTNDYEDFYLSENFLASSTFTISSLSFLIVISL